MESTSPRAAETLPVFMLGSEKTLRTINEFFKWLETSKGLRLCEAFKPKYDWYVPVPANLKSLTREFLGKGELPESPIPSIPSIPICPQWLES